MREVPLRPKEYGLWALLLRHSDSPVSRETMCEEVWGGRYVSDFTINQTINHLRKKIGLIGKDVIITVPRNGYAIVSKFVDEREASINLPTDAHEMNGHVIQQRYAESVLSGENDKEERIIACEECNFIIKKTDSVQPVVRRKKFFKTILMRMRKTFVKQNKI